MVYILSGCAFVSFFKGCGKKTFLDIFRKHAAFITGSQYTGHLKEVNTEGGQIAFYRLDSSVDFYRYCSAFQPLSTPKVLFDSFNTGNTKTTHWLVISDIREKQWERVTSETEIIPNHEALQLHWKRCCWVYQYWSQSLLNQPKLPSLTYYGWEISNNS